MSTTREEVRKEIESLINRLSRENVSNTPDFILAEFMTKALEAAEAIIKDRDRWYGIDPKPGLLKNEVTELIEPSCKPSLAVSGPSTETYTIDINRDGNMWCATFNGDYPPETPAGFGETKDESVKQLFVDAQIT